MTTRRRSLLKQDAAQSNAASFHLDFTAGLALEDAAGVSLLLNSGGPAVAEESVIASERCICPEAGSYLLLHNPAYEAEALTVEVYMPAHNNGVIVSCGSENGTLAAMQWGVDNRQRHYYKRFTAAAQTANNLYGTTMLLNPNRQMLRVERRGSTVSYWVSPSGRADRLACAETRSNVGTDYMLYNAAMAGLGFRTGLVFPQGDVYVAAVHWERLDTD